MSYMKFRCAGCWVTHKFEHKVKSRHLRFINCVNFAKEFQKDFMPLDSEATAVNVLETAAMILSRQMVSRRLP